jgi:hypothetical protein
VKRDYVAHFHSTQKHASEFKPPKNFDLSEAVELFRVGNELAFNDEYEKADEALVKSWNLIKNTSIRNANSEVLRLIGNLILSRLIIKDIIKDDKDEDDLFAFEEDTTEAEPDGTLAFCYLWLAFEVSNYSDYYALLSIAVLFQVGIAGMMLAVAGFVETMPPSRSPILFAATVYKKVIQYIDLETRSYGDLNDKRWLSEDGSRPNRIDSGRRLSLSAHRNWSGMNIQEIAKEASRMFGSQISGEELYYNLGKPLREDSPESYETLFEDIIRNLKDGLGGNEYREIFAQSQIDLDTAIRFDNTFAVLTALYAKRGEHTSLTETTNRLAEIASELLAEEKYGLAEQLSSEALYRMPCDENRELYALCKDALEAFEKK